MKSPLGYQVSEFDCVPTSIINAIKFLFSREEIPPEIIKTIMLYSLDTFSRKGERGKKGTTYYAVQLICNWLNEFSKTNDFKISCESIEGEQVNIGPGNKLVQCLNQEGVVIIRVFIREGFYHYVLLTGVDKESIYIFDSYYREKGFANDEIEIISDMPFNYNRKVKRALLNSYDNKYFSMGEVSERECILIKRL